MNDRKRAWQILHTVIRLRATDEIDRDACSVNIGTIIRDMNSPVDLITELAGFGATFALMGDPKDEVDAESGESLGIVTRDPEHIMRLADLIGASVMQEPDEPDDEED